MAELFQYKDGVMTEDVLDSEGFEATHLDDDTTCPECGKEMDPEDTACPHCGAEFGFYCPECDEELPPGTKFCSNCGAKIE